MTIHSRIRKMLLVAAMPMLLVGLAGCPEIELDGAWSRTSDNDDGSQTIVEVSFTLDWYSVTMTQHNVALEGASTSVKLDSTQTIKGTFNVDNTKDPRWLDLKFGEMSASHRLLAGTLTSAEERRLSDLEQSLEDDFAANYKDKIYQSVYAVEGSILRIVWEYGDLGNAPSNWIDTRPENLGSATEFTKK